MDPKQAAALEALERVRDGMTVGLGTGSTATYFINALGERARKQGWHIRGVPTSERSRLLAQEAGIPLVDLNDTPMLDIVVDGADEADADLNLIKGGGGALLREKLVAAAAREFVVVCDSSKFKQVLGAFPLPVAIIPFGCASTIARLDKFGVEGRLRARGGSDTGPYVTDDGLYILDMHFGSIEDPVRLETAIKQVTGVVEVGLFAGMASRLVVGYSDGRTDEILPPG